MFSTLSLSLRYEAVIDIYYRDFVNGEWQYYCDGAYIAVALLAAININSV